MRIPPGLFLQLLFYLFPHLHSWIGVHCTSHGAKEGWFNGYNFDWASLFEQEVVDWKIEGSKLVVRLDDLLEQHDYVSALSVAERAALLWGKVS